MENRYELRYISNKDGKEKRFVCLGDKKKDESVKKCKDNGVKVVSVKKLYPVSERIEFGLESMYEHARYMMECEYADGNITDEEYDFWESIAEECGNLMHSGWLPGKEYGRAKELTIEREWIRYNRCLAAGMSERDAGYALG